MKNLSRVAQTPAVAAPRARSNEPEKKSAATTLAPVAVIESTKSAVAEACDHTLPRVVVSRPTMGGAVSIVLAIRYAAILKLFQRLRR